MLSLYITIKYKMSYTSININHKIGLYNIYSTMYYILQLFSDQVYSPNPKLHLLRKWAKFK